MKSKIKNKVTAICACLLICFGVAVAQSDQIFKQQCMPYVEVECDSLTAFLKTVVEPIYTKNKGNYNSDKLTLYIVEDPKNPGSCDIMFEIYRNRFGKFKQSYFVNDFTLRSYATKVGELKIAVYSTPNAPILKLVKGKKLCFRVPVDDLPDELWDKYVQPLYMQGTNDNFMQWDWHWENGRLTFKSVSSPCDWFKKLPKSFYTPINN